MPAELGEQLLALEGVEDGLASDCTQHGGEEHIEGLLLTDVADGSGLQRRGNAHDIAAAGHDKDPGACLPQCGNQRRAVADRLPELQVEEDEKRRARTDRCEEGFRAGEIAEHDVESLAPQGKADALGEKCMVFDDGDSRGSAPWLSLIDHVDYSGRMLWRNGAVASSRLHTAAVDVQPRLLADTLELALTSRGFRLVAAGERPAEVLVTHDAAAVADLVILLPREVGEAARVRLRGRDIGLVVDGIDSLESAALPNQRKVDVAMRDGTWVVPTERGGTDMIQDQIANIVAKVDKIPFDAIGGEVQDAAKSASALLGHLDRDVVPDTKKMVDQAQLAMDALREGLAAIRDNVAAADSPIQQSARTTLEELERAAFSLRGLADYLKHHPETILRGRASGPEPH